MAFYKGFSDSRMLLNDDFKNELCNTVYEWILGVKPIPETYKDWEIAPDIDLTNITDIKVTSTGESKFKNKYIYIYVKLLNYLILNSLSITKNNKFRKDFKEFRRKK